MLVRPARVPLHGLLATDTICAPCMRRLTRSGLIPHPRHVSRAAATTSSLNRTSFANKYFWANDVWRSENQNNRPDGHYPAPKTQDVKHQPPRHQTSSEIASVPIEQDGPRPGLSDTTLPHRRRKRRARDNLEEDPEKPLPLDASAQLSDTAATLPSNTLRQRFFTYLSLSKPRLTCLIVLTTTSAYSLFPVAISPLASHLSLSPLTLFNLMTGTALVSASANALNMLFEPAYDAQMSRTRTRPLVRGLLTSRAALVFALLTGIGGAATLYLGVNPTVAFLGATNIFLYAGVYTPLKRISVINTWAGAVVGGIPPLMGWAAAAGQALSTPNNPSPSWRELLFAEDGSSAGGWLLAALLFAWQFPHFYALAYPIRHEYAAAGYKMLVSTNVRKSALISFRYSVLMFPICAGLSWVGVTGWAFVGTSGIANAWLVREAWKYWRLEGLKGSARGCFWASVWHLPIVLVLAMIQKRGLWERFVQGGFEGDELQAWREYDDDEQDRRPVTDAPIPSVKVA